MNSNQQKYAAVVATLLDGHTVVTASRRLAREILLHFADYNLERLPVWERPLALPWSDWLQQVWQKMMWDGRAAAGSRVLGHGQYRLIWEQVITQKEGDGLLQTGAAARQAAQAWEIAHAWRLPLSQAREFASEDAANFLDWAEDYRQVCRSAGWTDRAQLADQVADSIKATGGSLASGPVMLAGFDELTPQQQHLIDTLECAGTEVKHWLPQHHGCAVTKRRVIDAEAELAAAASWCIASLRHDPGCSVGVVVPDLSERHDEVARIFEDAFAPGACEDLKEAEEHVFSVSAGPQLVRNPMIAAALGVIEMAVSDPGWSHASQMLRSQFLGDAGQEADRRAALDIALREGGSTRWTLEHIARRIRVAIDAGEEGACPALLVRMERALELRSGWPQRQDSHGWVQEISAWLDVFGWPGERTLTSSEFQFLARWRELLEEVATYESLLGDTSLRTVLGLLRRLSADERFKAESGRCAVQVLGVLEAAGLEFDKLWVCGLHDDAWPAAPAPTPFLPYALQRELGTPHSSSARELYVANLQLQRLIKSADDVLLSWPGSAGDQDLRPSPLIAVFPDAPDVTQGNKEPGNRAAELFDTRPIGERIVDSHAPELASPDEAKGGARILELQALCPFRACAELRLQARPLKQPVPGLDAINRGSIAHDSLFELWRALGDQATLAGLDPQARARILRRSIRKAVRPLLADSDSLLKRLLDLECHRLERLIEELLQQELARPPFEVELLEQRKTAAIGPLTLRTRIDRVDVLSDGGRLVLDYKTGAASPGSWFGSRPRSPQLPLYASALGMRNVRGLSFVKIRSAGVQFSGTCDTTEEMPKGVRMLSRAQRSQQGVEDWQELLTDWHNRLTRLATDFKLGSSQVNPLSGACRNCHLPALCRVDEKRDLGELADNA